MASSSPRWIHYFAVATAFLTWLLIIIGGVVHGTGSSLACPDWPTCYGSFFPEMVGGVFFEHSHRLVAATVGLLTIVLWLALLFKGPPRLRKWGLGAFLLVVFQGVLGGITVIYRLPTAVSTAHLGTSMLFFALLSWIAYQTGTPPVERFPSASLTGFRTWVGVTVALIYVQILIGALVRHTGAGLACLDFPLCQDSLWPALGSGQAKLQMVHRWGGVAVALAVVATCWRGWKVAAALPRIRMLLGFGIILVFVQIFLGYFSVVTGLGLFAVSAHLAVAALIWLDFICLRWNLSSSISAPVRAGNNRSREAWAAVES